MFIGFPAIISEWVELDSPALSLRNDALSDKHAKSIAKRVADVKGIIGLLLGVSLHRLKLNWRGLHP